MRFCCYVVIECEQEDDANEASEFNSAAVGGGPGAIGALSLKMIPLNAILSSSPLHGPNHPWRQRQQ
jgi:hypothetical protein